MATHTILAIVGSLWCQRAFFCLSPFSSKSYVYGHQCSYVVSCTFIACLGIDHYDLTIIISIMHYIDQYVYSYTVLTNTVYQYLVYPVDGTSLLI